MPPLYCAPKLPSEVWSIAGSLGYLATVFTPVCNNCLLCTFLPVARFVDLRFKLITTALRYGEALRGLDAEVFRDGVGKGLCEALLLDAETGLDLGGQ